MRRAKVGRLHGYRTTLSHLITRMQTCLVTSLFHSIPFQFHSIPPVPFHIFLFRPDERWRDGGRIVGLPAVVTEHAPML